MTTDPTEGAPHHMTTTHVTGQDLVEERVGLARLGLVVITAAIVNPNRTAAAAALDALQALADIVTDDTPAELASDVLDELAGLATTLAVEIMPPPRAPGAVLVAP